MANKKKKVTTTVTTTVTEEVINVPTNEKTHIICVLDRSGSMAGIINDSIGGFNTFLRDQKKLPDEATITVVLFDDKYEPLYDNVDIKKANELTSEVWKPRGTTALYDAIGKTINLEKARFERLGSEAPAKVLCVIVTDGFENASHEYKLNDVKKLIKDCENDDWNFLYLAANQDAFAVGDSFGVSRGNTITYTANAGGVAFMSATMNNASTSYRSMNSSSADFGQLSKKLIDADPDDKKDLNNNGNIVAGDITFSTGTACGNGGMTVNNGTSSNTVVIPEAK
jgi:uncharacterized protein YegL